MNRQETIGIRANLVMARNVEKDFAKKTALTVLINTLDTMLNNPEREALLQTQWEQNCKRYEEHHGPLAPIIGYLPHAR